MAALVIVALLLACLGAGRAVLGSGGVSARLSADGIAGLTGLALLTGLAGWFVLAGAYSATAGWALLTLGSGAFILELLRAFSGPVAARHTSGSLPIGALALGLLSLSLAVVRVLGELAIPTLNVFDDPPNYWLFPRVLLETGSFIQPFNFRRLSTLGAAPFLQSFFWKDFTIAAAGMTDAILGQLVIWAGVRAIPSALSTRPQPAWIGEALALVALLATFTIPRANAMPMLLPMGGALALILLTRRVAEADTPANGIRAALAWGLVAAWLINLRISNAPFPAVLWLAGALVAARHRNQPQGVRLIVAALTTLVGMLPWSLSLWQSSATPLFPLFAGNYRVEGGFSTPLDLADALNFVSNCLWASKVWIIAIIGCLAALRLGVRWLSLQVTAALIVFVAVTAYLGRELDSFSIYRYSTPILLAALVFFACSILLTGVDVTDDQRAPLWRLKTSLLGAGLALWLMIPIKLELSGSGRAASSNAGMITRGPVLFARLAAEAWDSGLTVPELGTLLGSSRANYEEAQARLPSDARLVAAVETPFFFRYNHQVIHTLDIPGVVSPPPGMPSFEGPEALAEYLRSRGYTHLAFTPPGAGNDLYSRKNWNFVDENGSPLVRSWARYALMFMQNEERLAESYIVDYRSSDLVVIDLRRPQ